MYIYVYVCRSVRQTVGRADGWTDGPVDSRTDGQVGARTGGRTDRRTGSCGQMDGRADRQMESPKRMAPSPANVHETISIPK